MRPFLCSRSLFKGFLVGLIRWSGHDSKTDKRYAGVECAEILPLVDNFVHSPMTQQTPEAGRVALNFHNRAYPSRA